MNSLQVYNVLDRLGYERVSYNLSSDWDLMWAHDYPFKKLKTVLKAMKKGQKVNKLPGKLYIFYGQVVHRYVLLIG